MNSTISGNSTGTSGSGIYNVGLPLHAANSTISGNSAGTSGGGIFNFAGLVEIANCTVSGNSASSGGGIYNSAAQFGAVLQTANTIFNAGASGENIFNDGGTVISDGYNLSSDDGGGYLNGPGDQINTDPMLGPLQNNGGPTLTHAPLPGSPAIDAGDPNFTPPPFRSTTNEALATIAHSVVAVASTSVQSRHSPSDRVRLPDRGQLRPKQTSVRFNEIRLIRPGVNAFRRVLLFFAVVETVLRVSLSPRRRDLPNRQVDFVRP